ncbi:MAG: hypothetical protein JW807_02965 [Spirochaetes bacterium]|nr:hypothetical protein [Spirochaetota bacterium]
MDSARINYRLVRDAYRSLNRKKFQEAIAVLEKVLASGLGDIYVLLLLSVAYLYTDQFGKLARFITKMKEMNPSYVPLVQVEAFLKLKAASDRDEALRIYIELMAKYPGDAHVLRGKTLISDADDFAAFQKGARFQDFVNIPRPPAYLKTTGPARAYVGKLDKRGIRIIRGRRFPWRLTGRVLLLAVIGAAAVAGVWYLAGSGLLRLPGSFKKPSQDYESVDMVSVSGTEYDLVKTVKKERVKVFYQSARDMTDDFNRARKLIKAEKHNDALYILNGIYSSNVNFVVKEKADFLVRFVMNLEDRDFGEISCGVVNENKYRYRGYAVRWKGRVGRVRDRGDSRLLTLFCETTGGDPIEADVFLWRAVPGLATGSRITIEGVIADFLGKDRRMYVIARNVRLLE